MKKTTINILCILIIVILSGSIIFPGIYLGMGVARGFNDGEATKETLHTPIRVSHSASGKEYFIPNGSLESKSGECYPYAGRSGIIMIPDKEMPRWYTGTTITCFAIEIILFVLLIIELIQFLININKNRIFDKRNVKRLRRVGIYLILIALIQCVLGMCDASIVDSLNIYDNSLPIVANWNFPWGNILIGMIALLMSQIWSMGLEMKQEQELTI